MASNDLFDGSPPTPTLKKTSRTFKREGKPTPAFETNGTTLSDSVKQTASQLGEGEPAEDVGKFLWATTEQLQQALPRERCYCSWRAVVDVVIGRCKVVQEEAFRRGTVPLRFVQLVATLPQVPLFRKWLMPSGADYTNIVNESAESYAEALVQLAVMMKSGFAVAPFFAIVVTGMSVEEYAEIAGMRPDMVSFLADDMLRHIARFAFDVEVP